MIKVRFLALQAPDLSPGQRYRVEAFIPSLEKEGIQIEYDWLLDKSDLRIFYGTATGWKKAMIAGKAAVRRARSVTGCGGVDLFLVQREAFFLGNEWSEWLAHLRAPIVLDFDDAIWIKSVSEANRRFAWLKNVDKFPRIVRIAASVIAGNDYLAAWARNYSDNVCVIPTCVDTDRFCPPTPKRTNQALTIGWSGSSSTISHLRPLLPVLEELKALHGDAVTFRVMGDPSFEHAPLGLRGEVWSPQSELEMLREIDIGLMPLPDDEWTRGKCGLKGLVSMSMGAATVMSPVGVNKEIVRNGVNGLLAETPRDWLNALSLLIRDSELRKRIGSAGRETVVSRYSVRRWAPELSHAFIEASRRGSGK